MTDDRATDQAATDIDPAAPRSRGTLALLEENCTVCLLCVRECPDWCIDIGAHKEERAAPTGGRPRQQNILDTFTIDFGLCLYCGICVDVCPFDALFWSPALQPAATSRDGLVQGRDLLRDALAAVPPPVAHDERAEMPKEAAKFGVPSADPGSADEARTVGHVRHPV